MNRSFPLLSLLCALSFPGSALVAAVAETPLTQEVHELRRDLQLQTRKIEVLSQQITELTRIIQTHDAAQPSPVPAPPSPPAPVAVAPATGSKPAPEPEIPKAEAVPPSIQHVVEKGETLTSIAKHYNIPLADLQKLNKITNERKLQIGQTLKVPAPKTVETTTEKKDHP